VYHFYRIVPCIVLLGFFGCTSTTSTVPASTQSSESGLRIKKPIGSSDDNPVSLDSWSTSAPYRFDFQAVASDTTNPITIGTTTTPSGVTPEWSLASAAGTLTGTTTSTPTYTAPSSEGEGTLTLKAVGGTTKVAGTREIKVYKDHLARDYDNFGTSRSCDTDWSFTKYGQLIDKQPKWNCFGSIEHAYNGLKGAVVNSNFTFKGWSKTEYNLPQSDDWDKIEGSLSRGDVVAFISMDRNSLELITDHAHTCVEGTTMYGANNEPKYTDNGPTWKWDTCTSRQYYNDVNSQYAEVHDHERFFRVIVYDKP